MKKILNANNSPLVVFVIISLIIPFFYFEIALDLALMPKFLLTSTLLILFLAFVFFKLKKKNYFDTSILRNKILWFFAVFVIINFTSIINATLVSEALCDSLKTFVFLVFFALGLLLISKQENAYKLISKAFCIFGLIAGIIGLIQIIYFLPDNNYNHQFTYLISATFSQRNLYAQILILSFPFAVFNIITSKGLWRWLGIIAASIELLVMIILLVRSVWVGLALSSFFSIILLFVFFKKFQINAKVIKNLFLIASAFVLLVIFSLFIYTKLDSSDTLKKQAHWLKKDPFGSVKERIEMWSYSTEMIKDNAVVGVGAGNWKIILPKYANKEIREINKLVYTNFQRAHNDFLQVAAETGIIGLVFYLLIFLCFLYYVFRIIIIAKNQHEKLFALFMFFGIVSYIVISSFSFPKERISHSIILSFVFITITILYHKNKKPKKAIKSSFLKLGLIPIFLLLVIAVICGISRINGENHTQKVYEYKERNNHLAVIHEVDKAYSWFYQIDPYSTPLKWHSGTSWFLSGNLNNAYNDFNDSYKIAPYHKHLINDLATCYELKGNHEMSEHLYKKAISISPKFEEALINLSIIKYNAGNTSEAYDYLRSCDPETENEKYYAALKVFLPIITVDFINELDDEIIVKTFYSFLAKEDWMLKIHKHSVIEGREYNQQLIKEAIYFLEDIDSTISPTKAEEYRLTFGLKEL